MKPACARADPTQSMSTFGDVGEPAVRARLHEGIGKVGDRPDDEAPELEIVTAFAAESEAVGVLQEPSAGAAELGGLVTDQRVDEEAVPCVRRSHVPVIGQEPVGRRRQAAEAAHGRGQGQVVRPRAGARNAETKPRGDGGADELLAPSACAR